MTQIPTSQRLAVKVASLGEGLQIGRALPQAA